MMAMITTIVVSLTSLNVGHVTFRTSALTSIKKVLIRVPVSLLFSSVCNNLFVITSFPVLSMNAVAGQEGFEPPSSGFGDRRSSRWSYWPILLTSPLYEACDAGTRDSIFSAPVCPACSFCSWLYCNCVVYIRRIASE